MKKQNNHHFPLVFVGFALLLTVTAPALLAQGVGPNDWEDSWEAGVYTGYFSGGEAFRTKTAGEPVKGDMDDGWLFGGRLGADSEFFGWEASLAGVFADMNLKEDESVNNNPSAVDAGWLLMGVNAMVYPTGNYLNDGRIRPFVTAGPGAAFFFSDFDDVDSDIALDFNAGAGIKFLLGDEGKQVLRLDWKWHFLNGGSDLKNSQYYQELTIGLGFGF
ncbi:MAG: hypothetical protein K9M57_04465 [Phycisphaerae bacterium]|nr:hypothetical protein [Phycisphaerae bacterium]